MKRRSRQRPETSFDPGLQHERTALAWERTAIVAMVAGILLARAAATEDVIAFAAYGVIQTVFGAGLLIWTGWHYDELHGPLRSGESVVHPKAARSVGLAVIAFTFVALTLAIVLAFDPSNPR